MVRYTKSGIAYTAKPMGLAGVGGRRAAYSSGRPAPKYVASRAGYTTVARTRGVYGSGEMKYYDLNADAAINAVTTTWAGTENDPATKLTLLAPTVGAAINQRIGREVKVFKIKIRGAIRVPVQTLQSTQDPTSTIRLILAQDCQTNAAQMQGEELMADGANAPTTIQAFQNLSNFGRFKVLKDKVYSIGDLNMANDAAATGNIVQAGKVIQFKWTINFKVPVKVRFNAVNGGTIADIVDNSWHVIAGCSSAALVPSIQYSSRVCYKE